MDTLDTLHQQFCRERQYLLNLRPRSIEWHQLAWQSLKQRVSLSLAPGALNRSHLEAYVYSLRGRGVKPVSVNSRLRSLNAFCRWLHVNGHTNNLTHLPQLKVEHRLVKTLDEATIHTLVSFKPRTFDQWRTHTLVLSLLDSGCRLGELREAHIEAFNLDDCLVRVVGKGDRERRVPFSLDLRRVLFIYFRERERRAIPGALAFPTRDGRAWRQRNATRSLYALQAELGLPRWGFHRLRHTFATEYLRAGGDIVRLSRSLGHRQLSTTMVYLHTQTADLQEAHAKLGILQARGYQRRGGR